MLMDVFSFTVGGAVGTVVGYLLCALMTKEIKSDEQDECPFNGREGISDEYYR